MIVTYYNIGTLDFFLLRLGASHSFLYFHRSTYFPENTDVKEDEGDVRKEFGEESLGDKVVVDDIVLIGP